MLRVGVADLCSRFRTDCEGTSSPMPIREARLSCYTPSDLSSLDRNFPRNARV